MFSLRTARCGRRSKGDKNGGLGVIILSRRMPAGPRPAALRRSKIAAALRRVLGLRILQRRVDDGGFIRRVEFFRPLPSGDGGLLGPGQRELPVRSILSNGR